MGANERNRKIIRYENAEVFIEGAFQNRPFEVKEGRFIEPGAAGPADEIVDLSGLRVIPGLVDAHIHGAGGYDCTLDGEKGITGMAEFLAKEGVTSFAPTMMTVPKAMIEEACADALAAAKKCPAKTARVRGIHLEGPFLSMARKGAQNPEYLQEPNADWIEKLNGETEGLLRIVDVAPEVPGGINFVEEMQRRLRKIKLSIAHSDADYACAKAAFEKGVTHVTHMFNQLPSIHHRAPGPIAAAFDCPWVTAELVGDLQHVQAPVVRMAFKLFEGRICLISDALSILGRKLGDEAELGGQTIRMTETGARLLDGTLAGGSTSLYENMCRVIGAGIPAESVIQAVTEIPAGELGDKEIGRIAPGALADFIVCTPTFERKAVYLGGTRI